MKQDSTAYLTFYLNDEKFAIPVEHVQEIVEYGQVTRVPHAPQYMVGIINLRGRILPLLDTKIKLGLTPTVPGPRTRVMVLEVHNGSRTTHIGAIVDIAREVVEINSSEITPATDVDHTDTSAPLTGIYNNHGDITLLMDIAKVFAGTQFELVD